MQTAGKVNDGQEKWIRDCEYDSTYPRSVCHMPPFYQIWCFYALRFLFPVFFFFFFFYRIKIIIWKTHNWNSTLNNDNNDDDEMNFMCIAGPCPHVRSLCDSKRWIYWNIKNGLGKLLPTRSVIKIKIYKWHLWRQWRNLKRSFCDLLFPEWRHVQCITLSSC